MFWTIFFAVALAITIGPLVLGAIFGIVTTEHFWKLVGWIVVIIVFLWIGSFILFGLSEVINGITGSGLLFVVFLVAVFLYIGVQSEAQKQKKDLDKKEAEFFFKTRFASKEERIKLHAKKIQKDYVKAMSMSKNKLEHLIDMYEDDPNISEKEFSRFEELLKKKGGGNE